MLKLKRIRICRPGLVRACLGPARAADWMHIGPFYDQLGGPKALRDTATQSKKCSHLFGLFRYQAAGKRLRLFYIPVLTARLVPAQAAAK